jgi:hypothetical protein
MTRSVAVANVTGESAAALTMIIYLGSRPRELNDEISTAYIGRGQADMHSALCISLPGNRMVGFAKRRIFGVPLSTSHDAGRRRRPPRPPHLRRERGHLRFAKY